MPTTRDDVLSWRGQNLVDSDGDKIGKIEEIYLDAETDEPEWALVKTGLFGDKQTSCRSPTRRATATTYACRSRRRRSRTRRTSTRRAALASEEERTLYAHYGREYYDSGRGGGRADPHRDRPRHGDATRRRRARPDRPRRRRRSATTRQRPDDRRRDDALRGGAARRHHRARVRPRAPAQVRRRRRGHRDGPGVVARRSASSASRSPTPTAATRSTARRSPRRSTRSCSTRRRSWSRSAPCPKERVRLDKDVETDEETGLRDRPQGRDRRRRRHAEPLTRHCRR